MHKLNREQIAAGKHYAKAWLDGIHPETRTRFSSHDVRALEEAFAWSIYRQKEGIAPNEQLPKAANEEKT